MLVASQSQPSGKLYVASSLIGANLSSCGRPNAITLNPYQSDWNIYCPSWSANLRLWRKRIFNTVDFGAWVTALSWLYGYLQCCGCTVCASHTFPFLLNTLHPNSQGPNLNPIEADATMYVVSLGLALLLAAELPAHTDRYFIYVGIRPRWGTFQQDHSYLRLPLLILTDWWSPDTVNAQSLYRSTQQFSTHNILRLSCRNNTIFTFVVPVPVSSFPIKRGKCHFFKSTF